METLHLNTINELLEEYSVSGKFMLAVDLYVVSKGTQVINGRFIKTISRKLKVVANGIDYDFYASYKGKTYKVEQLYRGVCCGYDLAISI